MTAETDLLPSSVAAFTEALKGERGLLDAWLEVSDEREVAAHIEAYASARVARATAAKDAEVEALRAEVDLRDSVIATHAADTREYQKRISQAEARAEEMKEALREWWASHRPIGWTEDQHRACPHVNIATDAGKALADALLRDQEEGK